MKPGINYWRHQHLLPNLSLKLRKKLNQKTFFLRIVNSCRAILQRAIEPPQLRVWQTWDEQGVYWNARDPVTGRSIERVSESQIRAWIEQRYR